MPSDIKAILSVVVLLVAAGFAYWEHANGNSHLPVVIIAFGVFAVIAMWVFPEAISRADLKKKT